MNTFQHEEDKVEFKLVEYLHEEILDSGTNFAIMAMKMNFLCLYK